MVLGGASRSIRPEAGTTHLRLSAVLAILLSFVVAGQTFASAWSGAALIASDALGGNAWQGWSELIRLSDVRAVALYQSSKAVYIRRSTDAGASWSTRAQVSTTKNRGLFAAAGRGLKVDLLSSPEWDGYMKYSRSTDGGRTFSTRRLDWTGDVYDVAIARGCCGLVALAWTDNDGANVRVSENGGRTFGPTVVLGYPFESYANYVALAIAGGWVYVVEATYDSVQVRRSDNGVDWSDPIAIGSGLEVLSLTAAAEGDRVYVAYEVWDRGSHRVFVLGSEDGGDSWTPPTNLYYNAWQAWPAISAKDGVVRLALQLCTKLKWSEALHQYRCLERRVDYYENVGGTWTDPEQVAVGGAPHGVVKTDDSVVLYQVGTSLYVKSRLP